MPLPNEAEAIVRGPGTVEHGTDAMIKRKRIRGTIPFPYSDLDDASTVARAIWAAAGASSGSLDRVAARTGHKGINSGAFRIKVNSARLFGLITVSGMDVTITDLGRRVVDPGTERAARAEAFLKVELFDHLFQRYRGSPLPGPSAIEQEMISEGVSPNQKARARQTFLRSARQAGFFEERPDRLIPPAAVPAATVEGSDELVDRSVQRRAEPRMGFPTNPLIEGLFRMLPPEGPFSSAMQKRWLEAARVNLALVYGSDEGAEGKEGG